MDTQIGGEMVQGTERQDGQSSRAAIDGGCAGIYGSVSPAGDDNITAVIYRGAGTDAGITVTKVLANPEARAPHALFHRVQKAEAAAIAGSWVVNETVAAHNNLNDTDMPREKELLERIRQLEELNSALQDKLDMIYSILAPDYEEMDPAAEQDDDEDEGPGPRLVQIDTPKKTS